MLDLGGWPRGAAVEGRRRRVGRRPAPGSTTGDEDACPRRRPGDARADTRRCGRVAEPVERLLAARLLPARLAPVRAGADRGRGAGRAGGAASDGGLQAGEREPGKSDQIDALAIAGAVVKDGVERFPAAYLDQTAMEIRLLSDHRRDLVAERTRVQNRLRWHLLELCPELEHSLGRGSLANPRQLARVDRRLRRLPSCARVRIAREHIAQLRALTGRRMPSSASCSPWSRRTVQSCSPTPAAAP
jgi:hypothetical protein